MKTEKSNRKNEKGAALVTVLLMMALLLTGCIALLAGASLLTANVTDAVAEQQAYNAAESGIQTAINVLRRNTAPNPLIDPTKPTTNTDNKIDYARAVNLETSNFPSDPSPDARLSRWINYNCNSPGATAPDRASIGDEPCDSTSLSSFSVTVRDPDNPTSIIALTTSAVIGTSGDSETYGDLFNNVTIKYNSVSNSTNITTRDIGITLGSFSVTKGGLLNNNSVLIADTPFTITVRMTAPLPAIVKLRGTIKAGTAGMIAGNSVGTVKIVFDSPIYSLLGSIITLPVGDITPNSPSVNNGKTDLSVRITLSQPRRLVIRSVGYGPRGARKVFEAIVKRDNFDGLIPATVTLVGSLTGSLFKSSDSMGKYVEYSGGDILSPAKIPSIGTIGGGSGGLLSGILGNLTGALCINCKHDTEPADVSSDETPDFLKSAANLDARINEFRETAKASGRYFNNDKPWKTEDGFGDGFNGTGITFVDGDAVLSGLGGGILIVTGKLTLGGAVNFKGTILATGADGVRKTGGGNSTLNGNLVVAPYRIGNTLAGFLPPKYDITGGTAGSIIYKASNLLFGSDNFNTVVVSVGEK